VRPVVNKIELPGEFCLNRRGNSTINALSATLTVELFCKNLCRLHFIVKVRSPRAVD
jgi:hypothetical protein